MTLIKKERRKSPINSTVVSRITEPARLFCIKKFFQYVSLFGTNVYYWKFPVCLFIFECVNFSILNESSKIMIFFSEILLKSIFFSKCRTILKCDKFSSVKQVFVHISKTGFFVFGISNVRVPKCYLHVHYLKQDEMSANYCQKIVSVNIP